MKTASFLLVVAAGVLLLLGCDDRSAPQALPEVNEANCQLEKIKEIQDKTSRENFAGLCSRQLNGISPTKNAKNWLELTDSGS